MNQDEKAAISYNPDDDEEAGTDGLQVALAEAERRLGHSRGVKGMGRSQTTSGKDAIVVYVEDQQALSQLPADIDGFTVVGEVTGEIRAL